MSHSLPVASVSLQSNLQGKPNQDVSFVGSFPSARKWKLAFVCDGHGVHGHIISSFIKDKVVSYMVDASKNNPPLPSLTTKNYKNPKVMREYGRFIHRMVDVINEDLKLMHPEDSQHSGCTLAGVWFVDKIGVNFNVGDSRCVIISKTEKRVHRLSNDHKPDSETERKRIKEAGGFVGIKDAGGIHRLWKNSYMEHGGLALSRSMGDFSSSPYGLSAVPAVRSFDASKSWTLIIATDGLWDCVEDHHLIAMMQPDMTMSEYGNRLLQHVVEECKGAYRDDTTIVTISLPAFTTMKPRS